MIDISLETVLKVIPDYEYYEITEGAYVKEGNSYTNNFEFPPIKTPPDATEGMSKANKVAYYWFVNNPDQHIQIKVKGLFKRLNFTNNKEARDTLLSYGIIDPDYLGSWHSRKHYFVILGSKDIPTLKQSYLEFCEKNLPEDSKPSAIIVEDKLEYLTFRELTNAVRKCKELNGVRFLNNYTEYQDEKSRQDRLNSLIEHYKGPQFRVTDFIDITKYTNDLDREVSSDSSYSSYTKFNLTIEYVLKQVKEIKSKNPKRRVLVYSTNENLAYVVVCAQLKYFYNISCITMDTGGRYRSILADLVYHPDYMQAGDRLAYLQNIPTHLFKITDFGLYAYFVGSRSITCSLSIVKLTDDNKLDGDVINPHIAMYEDDLQVGNITDLFDFKDLTKIKESDRKLRELLYEFYLKLKKDLPLDMVHPCNTLLITWRGVRYIAKLEGLLGFNITGVMLNNELGRTVKYTFTNVDSMIGWIPFDFLADAGRAYPYMNKAVSKYLVNDLVTIRYERVASPNALFFRHLFSGYGKLVRAQDAPKDAFIDCMVNTPALVRNRVERTWYKVFKDNPRVLEQLTSFYCMDILSSPIKKIKLDEVSLARHDLIGGGIYD